MWPVCGKFLVVLGVIALLLGFAYHLYHNLRADHAGRDSRPTQAVPARLMER